MKKSVRFYTDKPIFGLDIGRGSLKVMQLEQVGSSPEIIGYGATNFDAQAIDKGVVVKPEVLAVAMHELFEKRLEGEITTRRVAVSLPDHRVFTRSIQLPALNHEELREAVQLEVEQYVPMQLQDLYLDYVATDSTQDSLHIFVVAASRRIVDSYLDLATKLGLEPILVEPAVMSTVRFLAQNKKQAAGASIVVDFGSLMATVSIYDKTTIATSSVPAGGLVFTEAIRNELGVSQEEANDIKTQFGLDFSEYQEQISKALKSPLEKVVAEIRRMLRYHAEHYSGREGISRIIILGGGANMPGLSSYLTDTLRIPATTNAHPWGVFRYDRHLKMPPEADRQMYSTVAGLAVLNPKEVFAQ